MQRTATTKRGEARSSAQVFRDAATLLLLVLLALSVRFDGNEDQASAGQRPIGLQAAEVEAAAPALAEPAVRPAAACPKSDPVATAAAEAVSATLLQGIAGLEEDFRQAHRERRLLIFKAVSVSTDCDDRRPRLVRS